MAEQKKKLAPTHPGELLRNEIMPAVKLTQEKLADLAGTKQSVISRIEDADYYGHSLRLLRRIARALGKKLRVEFCACPTPPASGHTAD